MLVPKGNPKDLHTYADFTKDGLKVAIMAGADQLNLLHGVGVTDAKIVTIASNTNAIPVLTSGRANAYAGTGLTVSELTKKSERVELADDFTDPVTTGSRCAVGAVLPDYETFLRTGVVKLEPPARPTVMLGVIVGQKRTLWLGDRGGQEEASSLLIIRASQSRSHILPQCVSSDRV